MHISHITYPVINCTLRTDNMRRNRCPFHHLYNVRNVRYVFPVQIFFCIQCEWCNNIVNVCERMDYTRTFNSDSDIYTRETISSNPSEISKLFPLSESKAKYTYNYNEQICDVILKCVGLSTLVYNHIFIMVQFCGFWGF